MEALTSIQRKFLRGLANHLDALIIVGKAGVTESLIRAVDSDLNAHELIKVRFNEFKDQKDALAEDIRVRTNSHVAGRVGHVAIFYREHSDPEKRKIVLPVKK